MWGFALAPLIGWIVLVSLLLCLRGIPFLKWRFALQPTLAGPHSNQPRRDSLTRGILIVVASWASVLMLLKDSWPWSGAATAISESPDDLLIVSGIAALVGAGALVVAILAVSLTLTRLADWMFYRRRWTLPLLAILLTAAAILLLLSFTPAYRSGSERLRAVLWLLAGMATQPLATLLVMGLAGYRLAPRKQPGPDGSESSFQTATTTTEKPVANWFLRLQCSYIASLVAALMFFVAFVPTGALNRHHLRIVSWRYPLSRHVNNAGEITRLKLSEWATNNSLRALSDLDKLQALELRSTKITDAGLIHLKGLTNLQKLTLRGSKITDAGTEHLKGLTNLEELNLSHTQITDAGIAQLAGMNLKSLVIPTQATTDIGLKHFLAAIEPRRVLSLMFWGRVTDAGIAQLAGMNLKRLDIRKQVKTDLGLKHYLAAVAPPTALSLGPWKITDAGLVHLKGMTKLEDLNLYGTKITDVGLVHLKGLTNLQNITLPKQITDAGLEHLKGLTNLKKLNLNNTQITDAGLVHLKGLTNLKLLSLYKTQITDAGIAELQKALPNCKITK